MADEESLGQGRVAALAAGTSARPERAARGGGRRPGGACGWCGWAGACGDDGANRWRIVFPRMGKGVLAAYLSGHGRGAFPAPRLAGRLMTCGGWRARLSLRPWHTGRAALAIALRSGRGGCRGRASPPRPWCQFRSAARSASTSAWALAMAAVNWSNTSAPPVTLPLNHSNTGVAASLNAAFSSAVGT